MNTENTVEIREDYWWRSERFFRIYFDGDDSFEGPFPDNSMNRTHRTVHDVNNILKLIPFTQNNLALDVPCGWGRHSVELAKRGYNVIGIDLNKQYIETGVKEKINQEIPNDLLQFLEGDMRNIPMENDRVDVIINMFTSFGFFAAESDNKRVVHEFYRVLKPNGYLLIHLDFNPISVIKGEWDEKENRNRSLLDNRKLFITETYDPDTKRIFGNWKITNPPGSLIPFEEESYSWRVYSPHEMQKMLTDCGFKKVSHLCKNGDEFQPLDQNATEVFIIAQK